MCLKRLGVYVGVEEGESGGCHSLSVVGRWVGRAVRGVGVQNLNNVKLRGSKYLTFSFFL